MYSFYDIAALFLAYAFLGWCTEVIYAAVTTGRIINRGFLNGPVCPIYGFGMIGVLLLLRPFSDRLIPLFFCGMLLCSALELVGGWALKQFFHTRWWDYSMRPMNIGGYVCLSFSILWGLAVVFVVRLVQPLLLYGVELLPQHLPPVLLWILMAVLYALFAADLALTLVTIIGLQKKLRELERIAEALHNVSDELSERLAKSAINADSRLDEMKLTGKQRLEAERQEMEEAIADSRQYLAEQKQKLQETAEENREKLDTRLQQAEEAIAWQKHQLEETIVERKQKLQQSIAESMEHISDQRELLTGSIGEELERRQGQREERRQALERRREQLLLQQQTVLKKLGASSFGPRRLFGAFPALHEDLKQRIRRDQDT